MDGLNFRKTGMLFLAVTLLFSVLTLTACGPDIENHADPEEDIFEEVIDASELAGYLEQNITFSETLIRVDDGAAAELYGITDYADCCVYISTGATAEEIAVFVARSADEALAMVAPLTERIDSQRAIFENANPSELEKLDQRVITQMDSAVVMIVAPDRKEVQTAVDTYCGAFLNE